MTDTPRTAHSLPDPLEYSSASRTYPAAPAPGAVDLPDQDSNGRWTVQTVCWRTLSPGKNTPEQLTCAETGAEIDPAACHVMATLQRKRHPAYEIQQFEYHNLHFGTVADCRAWLERAAQE